MAAELATATPAIVQAMANSGQIFPAPSEYVDPISGISYYGDVANLPGDAQHYDSVWVDFGYPVVRLAATNRKIKPMFAFLIVDMDGRVNMNVAGNVREGSDASGGNVQRLESRIWSVGNQPSTADGAGE